MHQVYRYQLHIDLHWFVFNQVHYCVYRCVIHNGTHSGLPLFFPKRCVLSAMVIKPSLTKANKRKQAPLPLLHKKDKQPMQEVLNRPTPKLAPRQDKIKQASKKTATNQGGIISHFSPICYKYHIRAILDLNVQIWNGNMWQMWVLGLQSWLSIPCGLTKPSLKDSRGMDLFGSRKVRMGMLR